MANFCITQSTAGKYLPRSDDDNNSSSYKWHCWDSIHSRSIEKKCEQIIKIFKTLTNIRLQLLGVCKKNTKTIKRLSFNSTSLWKLIIFADFSFHTLFRSRMSAATISHNLWHVKCLNIYPVQQLGTSTHSNLTYICWQSNGRTHQLLLPWASSSFILSFFANCQMSCHSTHAETNNKTHV